MPMQEPDLDRMAPERYRMTLARELGRPAVVQAAEVGRVLVVGRR